ncbi:unnamed protein product [Paramecium sonneborni]|uniref:non-specific serine/threonine protein kinase n=1 Tax=Paramecium sonneborni TaxID=65129 RepID=A0A8S1KLP3_9CILI|nr:unnamed protein product [Paramecium sonneborni]
MDKNSQKVRKSISNYTYALSDLIGSGYSSKVYKGINTITNQVVAIKVISMQQLNTPISKSLLKNEINVLKLISHPNLMKVFETFESQNNTYLICEYCNEGDLADILESSTFTETDALQVLQQIIQGIKALHDKKIIHRDIKPANILKSDGVYKLADFGFAVIENQYESIIKKFNVGTPMYMAPETIQCNEYSEKSDIWALGIVLYQMLYKQLPSNLKQVNDIEKKHSLLINKILTDNQTSNKTKELLLNMLNFDSSKRYSVNEINQQLNPTINSPKRLSTTSHQNIPCKSIKSIPSSLDQQSQRVLFDDTLISKQITKSQPDEILEKNLMFPKSQNLQDNHKPKIIKVNQISSFKDLKINLNPQSANDQYKINNKQQILKTLKPSQTLNLYPIGNSYKESPLKIRDEQSTKRLQTQISNEFIDEQFKDSCFEDKAFLIKAPQIQTNIIQTPLKTSLNNKSNLQNPITLDESECKQNSHQNSTNDTIKQNQLSNCLQVFQEKQNLKHDNDIKKLNNQNNHFKTIKSPVRIINSQKTIITPPFKSSGICEQKKSQDFKPNYFIQTRGTSPIFQQESLSKLISNLSIEKVTTEFSKKKEDEKEEQPPAKIRPTFKFLNYLNQIIKNFDNINTEDKQKCYFLLRKLLGIKATYVQQCHSLYKQELIQQWIDNFLSYYSKVENVFYTSPDKSFEQFFNKDLTQFSISFSQLLLFYLQKITLIKLNKDIQIISEIISENIRQSNDPVLFARRWENDQP